MQSSCSSRKIRTFATGFSCLCIIGTCVHAQTNIVPPSKAEQQKLLEQQRSKDALTSTVDKAATTVPGAIMEGSVTVGKLAGAEATRKMFEGAELGGEVLSKTVSSARILAATVGEGREGFVRESGQFILDSSVDEALRYGVITPLVNAAAAGGASLGLAGAAASIAYTTGSIAGTWIREETAWGRRIGSAVDESAFRIAPDWLKEAVSGVPQVDFESKAYQAKEQEDARRRRQLMFDRVDAERAAQQRQIDESRVLIQDRSQPDQPDPEEQRQKQASIDMLTSIIRQGSYSQPKSMTRVEPAKPASTHRYTPPPCARGGGAAQC